MAIEARTDDENVNAMLSMADCCGYASKETCQNGTLSEICTYGDSDKKCIPDYKSGNNGCTYCWQTGGAQSGGGGVKFQCSSDINCTSNALGPWITQGGWFDSAFRALPTFSGHVNPEHFFYDNNGDLQFCPRVCESGNCPSGGNSVMWISNTPDKCGEIYVPGGGNSTQSCQFLTGNAFGAFCIAKPSAGCCSGGYEQDCSKCTEYNALL